MDSPVVIGIATFLFGTLVPLLAASFLPNEWFFKLGVKSGRDLSRFGRKLVGDPYEKFENTLMGSFQSFANGLIAGADEDDNEPDAQPL